MNPAKPHRVLNLTWRQLLIAALCQLLATTALYAQISNASINGTVRDATGAIVPEAVILLRNTATGVESRTVTNDQGIYIILNILPGNYTLEGSKAGFQHKQARAFQPGCEPAVGIRLRAHCRQGAGFRQRGGHRCAVAERDR